MKGDVGDGKLDKGMLRLCLAGVWGVDVEMAL